MKTLLFSLFASAMLCQGQALPPVGTSVAYRGEYFGIVLPSRCANERLGLALIVDSDGNVICNLRDYDNGDLLIAGQSWPLFQRGRFTTDITGLGNYVRGVFSAGGGLCRGIVSLNGCLYTFTVYRRFRVAP